jgi:hypothetical protein
MVKIGAKTTDHSFICLLAMSWMLLTIYQEFYRCQMSVSHMCRMGYVFIALANIFIFRVACLCSGLRFAPDIEKLFGEKWPNP